jgi:hypothetical protein
MNINVTFRQIFACNSSKKICSYASKEGGFPLITQRVPQTFFSEAENLRQSDQQPIFNNLMMHKICEVLRRLTFIKVKKKEVKETLSKRHDASLSGATTPDIEDDPELLCFMKCLEDTAPPPLIDPLIRESILTRILSIYEEQYTSKEMEAASTASSSIYGN